MKPIIEKLSPYADLLEDGRGGFRDSVAADFRKGRLPRGGGFYIMIDILAKYAGRRNSNAYIAEYNKLEKFFEDLQTKIEKEN